MAHKSPGGRLINLLQAMIQRLTAPSALIPDHVGRRQARLLSSALLVLIAAALLLGMIGEASYQDEAVWHDSDFWIAVMSFLVFMVLYGFSRTRYYLYAAALLIVMLSLATFAIALPSEGQGSDANMLIYLVIPVVLSSVLLSYRATVMLIAGQTLGTVLYFLAYHELSAEYDWTGYILIISLMVLFVTRHTQQTDQQRRSELAVSEEFSQRTFEAIPDPALVWERQPDGRVIMAQANLAARVASQGKIADYLGTPVQEFFVSAPQSAADVLHALETGETVRKELLYPLRTTGEVQSLLADYSKTGTNHVLNIIRDVTERRRAVETLQKSEQHFRDVLENLRLIAVTLDTQGNITYCNEYLLKLTGWKREEVIGQSWFDYFIPPGSQRDEVRSIFLGYMIVGSIIPHYENYIQTRQGEPRLILWNNSILLDPQNGQVTGTTSVGEDITERRRIENAEREQRAFSEALRQTAATVNRTLNLDEVLDRILTSIEGVVPHEAANIILLGQGQSARVARSRGYDNYNPIDGINFDLGTLPGTHWMVENRQVLIIPDCADSPLWMDVPETRWVRSFMGAPIMVDGQVIGILNVDSAVPNTYTPDYATRLQAFADHAGTAIRNAQLYSGEREQHALSDALRSTAEAVNSTLDLDEVLARILTNIEPVVKHDAANIMLFEGHIGYIAGHRGYEAQGTAAWVNTTLVDANERPGLLHLLRAGQGYLIDDTHSDPLWRRRPQTDWVHSLLSIPIRVEGRVIGVLNLDDAHPHAFTQKDLERLQAFADQAAAAIRNARLYAEVRRYTDELERRVNERTTDLSVRNAVAETLSSSLDMHEMLTGVLRTTVQQLGVSGGAIHLLSPDLTSLDIAAVYGVSAETINRVIGLRVDDSNPALIPYAADDLGEDAEFINQTGIRAAISVPIWQQEHIQGVITVVHNQRRPWSTEETRMIDAIGRQIGMALINARLFTKVVGDEAKLRTILQSAGDGLLVFDQDDHLTLMNPAAEKLFAFYPAEQGGPARAAALLWGWLRTRQQAGNGGRTDFPLPMVPLILEGEQGLAARCRVKNCLTLRRVDRAWPCWLQAGGIEDDHLSLCAARQTLPCRAVQAQTTQVCGASGDVQGTVIALHDVTYFRELDELKDRFVSNVSHELRNPLSSMLLQISTLLRYYDRFADNDRRRMVGEIQQQAYTLRELIEDILEVSRFDAGQTHPQKTWFDMAEQARQVVASLELAAREKNQSMAWSGLDGSCHILADPHQITRALRNLIGNAIKYTPEGGQITLNLAADRQEIQMSITDTGIGIAPEDLAHIFDRFYRASDASEMASGTGLGLSITKEIIDLHGGRIEVQSTPGQGSTFTVYLPVPDSNTP